MPPDDRSGLTARALYAPAAARNREPILDVLRRVLPAEGLVLEVASGTGEHAAFFAEGLPGLAWQPSDPDPTLRGSIAAHVAEAGLANLRPPLALDTTATPWPLERADALLCINLIHIAPWAACQGLLAEAGRLLAAGAPLVLYGPFRRAGVPTAMSNERFDAALRAQDPAWGLRELETVSASAADQGFALEEVAEMPANNVTVVYRREPT